jgi:hypothetical protein
LPRPSQGCAALARRRPIPEVTRLLAALAAVAALLGLSLASVLPHEGRHGQATAYALLVGAVGGSDTAPGQKHGAQKAPHHVHGAQRASGDEHGTVPADNQAHAGHPERGHAPDPGPGHHQRGSADATPCLLCMLANAFIAPRPLTLPVAADFAAIPRWRSSSPACLRSSIAEVAHQPRAPPPAA